MKIIALLAAAAAATLAVPASAAPVPAQERHQTVTRTHTSVVHDRGRHHGRKMYWRKSCTNKWRNHHRVRVCRKVRAWR